RNAIKRHVDHRGDSASGRSFRGRSKSLPVSAPRLVDMDVRIDKAGHDDCIMEIKVFACRWKIFKAADCRDDALANTNRRGSELATQKDSAAANYLLDVAHEETAGDRS